MTQINPKQIHSFEDALQKIDELEKRIVELEQNTLTKQEYLNLKKVEATDWEDVFKQAGEAYQEAKK